MRIADHQQVGELPGFVDGDREAGFALEEAQFRQFSREDRRHGLENLHALMIRRGVERLGLPGTCHQPERKKQDEESFHV